MASVNILFLSDLHFTKKKVDRAKDYAKTLEECAKWYVNAVSGVKEDWKPQIIAIAGDIGYYGAAEDYQFFSETFLLPLMERLGISKDHVIMCPGNHDKDDSHIPLRSDSSVEVSWQNVQEIEKFEHNFKEMFYNGYRTSCNTQRFVLDTYALAPFQNYISFLKEQGIPAFDITKYDYDKIDDKTDDAKYLYGHRNIDGINFYCYNSAWDCLHYDKRDKGNLRIGPVRDRMVAKDERQFTISLVHHPQDWLSIEAVSSVIFRREVIANESDIAVHGHMHALNINQDEDGKVLLVQLPTWSSPDTDFERWQSCIFKVDIGNFSYFRMPIFWHRDNGHAYAATTDGITEHPLRLSKKLESEKENICDILEDLYRILLNNLERFMAYPNAEFLNTIIDLIKTIAQRAGKIATNKLVMDKMTQFYDKAISTTKANMPADIVYDELISSAGELRDSITPEIGHVLTRHVSHN